MYNWPEALRFELWEERLMITYLIHKKLIDQGCQRATWLQFRNAGYHQQRSVELLTKHYREKILITIETFGLPAELENKFLRARQNYIAEEQNN